MTRRHLTTLRLLLILGDAVIAMFVFLVVSAIRFQVAADVEWVVGIDIGLAALIFAAIWVSVAWAMGLYRLRVRWSLAAEARDVLRAALLSFVLTMAALFLVHQDDVSRLLLAFLFVTQPIASIAARGVLRRWFAILRRRGRNLTFMVVAGTGELAEDFANQVEAHPELGVRVIGHLTIPGADGTGAPSRPILGTVDQMSKLFRSSIIDEVAVCLPAESVHYLEPIIAVAADEGKTVRVPRDPEEAVLSGALQEDFGRYLVRSVVHDGQRELELAVKRLIDIAGALVALVILSPVIGIGLLAVRLRDGSPAFFRQTRIGLHGRPFTMYKIRSMEPGAEERLVELAAHNKVQGPAFKMDDDPRVTGVGGFLRRTSIDELPQLLNVLRGDMSLVGPRPALPSEVEDYDIWHRRRLSVRPGMTGLWQVEARSATAFDQRAELDLRYIDHWSLWMDFTILLRTLPSVVTQRGR